MQRVQKCTTRNERNVVDSTHSRGYTKKTRWICIDHRLVIAGKGASVTQNWLWVDIVTGYGVKTLRASQWTYTETRWEFSAGFSNHYETYLLGRQSVIALSHNVTTQPQTSGWHDWPQKSGSIWTQNQAKRRQRISTCHCLPKIQPEKNGKTKIIASLTERNTGNAKAAKSQRRLL